MTGLGVLSVFLAWGVVHTMFTLRYADLFYSRGRGIDFNENDAPDYCDVAYLAFTVGMTYQVSDTELQTKTLRRTALKHRFCHTCLAPPSLPMTTNTVAGL